MPLDDAMTQLPRLLTARFEGRRESARSEPAVPETAIVATLAKVTAGFVALMAALAVAHGAGELLGAL